MIEFLASISPDAAPLFAGRVVAPLPCPRERLERWRSAMSLHISDASTFWRKPAGMAAGHGVQIWPVLQESDPN
jgi:hypothetical protein